MFDICIVRHSIAVSSLCPNVYTFHRLLISYFFSLLKRSPSTPQILVMKLLKQYYKS